MFLTNIFVNILCLLLYAKVIEGQAFRSDYNYFDEVGGWMKLHARPAQWTEARLRCQLEGAVLASPLNDNLASTMISLIKENTITIFTGIHATFSKGDYHSIEGVPLSAIPTNRGQHELDNKDNDENCIAMLPYGTLVDVRCQDVYRFICYKKYDPKIHYQTDCGTTDTDYRFAIETGNCYKFHRVPRHWSRAFMTCASEGGYLVVINSPEEANVIRNLYATVDPKTVRRLHPDRIHTHAGFHDWGEHGTWLTVHGQTLKQAGYEVWRGNGAEPNNITHARGVGEYCGSLIGSAEMNDLYCNHVISFICEKDPKVLAVENKK